MKKDVGLIGLGIMGKGLAMNLASKGYSLAIFNRPEPETAKYNASTFIDQNPGLSKADGFEEIAPFIKSLRSPRTIFILIKAGEAVDQVLESLKPLLVGGDVIIEGGNSHFRDTRRRCEEFSHDRVFYLGTGISGGEEGAKNGPSIMVGGPAEGFEKIQDILQSIAARDKHGNSCSGLIGPDGAGHFVKMVHNGIEYGEMQLIAEVYSLMKEGLGLNPSKIANTYKKWIDEGSKSYLLEITIDILQRKIDGRWLINRIKDEASTKGTGSWTVQAASELSMAVPTIAAALFARFQSIEQQRSTASKIDNIQKECFDIPLGTLQSAYQIARIINHQQGFQLIEAASKKYQWEIDLSSLASIWTSGCIIQSDLMIELVEELKGEHDILSSPIIVPRIKNALPYLAELVSMAAMSGFATPALSASLNYIYSYFEDDSSANLIQALRDYFGAHGIQWKDDPSCESFHYQWFD